jgi:hypothetical protein
VSLDLPEGRKNVVRAWRQASVWRDVPFGAIQLAMFELVKAYRFRQQYVDGRSYHWHTLPEAWVLSLPTRRMSIITQETGTGSNNNATTNDNDMAKKPINR